MTHPSISLFKVFVADSTSAALEPVLHSGHLANGARVQSFEVALANWLGAPRVVALSDASAGIVMALTLAGVRPGDEVITSPIACAATLMPIANLFAKPVWCDIDPLTGIMAPEKIEALISEKTRAILLYHWSGDVADIAAIVAIAKRYGIQVIEDANAALGAQYQNRRLGGIADFTVYSFYATKHITAGGEGAALLAANPDDLDKAHLLRRFGIDTTAFRLPNNNLNPCFDIPVAGFNFPMNEIAATIAIEGLKHGDRITARHRDNGFFYESNLTTIPGLRLLNRRADSISAYWTYSLLADRRDELIRKLTSYGIGAQRLHMRHDMYSCFGSTDREALAGVARFDAENISLPCGWWVSNEDRAAVVECLRQGW
ncbi:MAG: aminotransferase class V-fold PLP-dependent enzyme [Undibacterium sp.]|uniref:DegT/DnrJ/EryC1/StrS family aminotransferase n=1 Tax=Undibacterium sp. TaxID=1914977 RepID=UPI0027227027|nr:aminotransferase class V-fold PLP-dependent enzyme [Undibacterium sp.]MDO8653793.1 aminotransferase class V-fold PLP-dependent enzyme [Undibacterium sp.]